MERKTKGGKSKDLTLEFIPVREMTEEEAESIARMYFTWWKRRHERLEAEEAAREKPTEVPSGIDFVI